ncbi:hypothetical protein SHIRM173S_11984 [Streptomyces hirsutus]
MQNTAGRDEVIVGIDPREQSVPALAWAADEAVRRRLPLRLVVAVPPLPGGRHVDAPWNRTMLQGQGESALTEAAATVRALYAEVPLATELLDGTPSVVLCRKAAQARMVVVGSRRLSRPEELFSAGSVAVPVSAQADCPVVVVREPERAGQRHPHLVVGVDGSGSGRRPAAADHRGGTLDDPRPDQAGGSGSACCAGGWGADRSGGVRAASSGKPWRSKSPSATLVLQVGRMGVKPVLRELHISSSAYYRWCRAKKEPCHRKRQHAELTEKVRQVHADSGGIYGSPRVHAVLKREGVAIGRKRVERLMREAGIGPRRTGRGFTRRDPDAGLVPDLVQRDFTASEPNRLWVTDLTMILTGEGQLVAVGNPRCVLPPHRGLGDLCPRRCRPGPDHAGVRPGQPRGHPRHAHSPCRPQLSVHVHQAHNTLGAGKN